MATYVSWFLQRAGAPAGERLQEGNRGPEEERGALPDDADLAGGVGGGLVQAGYGGRTGERTFSGDCVTINRFRWKIGRRTRCLFRHTKIHN